MLMKMEKSQRRSGSTSGGSSKPNLLSKWMWCVLCQLACAVCMCYLHVLSACAVCMFACIFACAHVALRCSLQPVFAFEINEGVVHLLLAHDNCDNCPLSACVADFRPTSTCSHCVIVCYLAVYFLRGPWGSRMNLNFNLTKTSFRFASCTFREFCIEHTCDNLMASLSFAIFYV